MGVVNKFQEQISQRCYVPLIQIMHCSYYLHLKTNIITNSTADHGIQFRMCCILTIRTKAKIAFTEM